MEATGRVSEEAVFILYGETQKAGAWIQDDSCWDFLSFALRA